MSPLPTLRTVNGKEYKYGKIINFSNELGLWNQLCDEANEVGELLTSYIKWKLKLHLNPRRMIEYIDVAQPITNTDQMLLIAKLFAFQKHHGAYRSGGDSFIAHPTAVMDRVDGNERKIVAILHDVIEDTDAEYNDLFRLGLPFYLVTHVRDMTRMKDEDYDKYIERVGKCQFCNPIKQEDVQHNLETLTPEIEKRSPNRRQKYQDSLKRLKILQSNNDQ